MKTNIVTKYQYEYIMQEVNQAFAINCKKGCDSTIPSQLQIGYTARLSDQDIT